jgi:hypothetical protein
MPKQARLDVHGGAASHYGAGDRQNEYFQITLAAFDRQLWKGAHTGGLIAWPEGLTG